MADDTVDRKDVMDWCIAMHEVAAGEGLPLSKHLVNILCVLAQAQGGTPLGSVIFPRDFPHRLAVLSHLLLEGKVKRPEGVFCDLVTHPGRPEHYHLRVEAGYRTGPTYDACCERIGAMLATLPLESDTQVACCWYLLEAMASGGGQLLQRAAANRDAAVELLTTARLEMELEAALPAVARYFCQALAHGNPDYLGSISAEIEACHQLVPRCAPSFGL